MILKEKVIACIKLGKDLVLVLYEIKEILRWGIFYKYNIINNKICLWNVERCKKILIEN